MTKKGKFTAVKRELTAEQRARQAAGRQAAEADRAEIMALGREALHATLQEVFARLKAERQSQGLTLAQIQERTGIRTPALSRLENEASNPTIDTICRVAKALGKSVRIELDDAE